MLTEEMLIVLPKLCESHRFYHNLDHISRMLHAHQLWKHHSNIEWTSQKEAAIYLAILYHDVVYDIKKDSTTNELKSAVFFSDNTKVTDVNLISEVIDLIASTERHFKPNYQPKNDLCCYFMDLDLMQLCTTDQSVLLKDNENIDKEFMTEFTDEYVYMNRYKFLKDVMAPSAFLRNIDNEILQDQMTDNIRFLVNTYNEKF